jgi:hypothetical protein
MAIPSEKLPDNVVLISSSPIGLLHPDPINKQPYCLMGMAAYMALGKQAVCLTMVPEASAWISAGTAVWNV